MPGDSFVLSGDDKTFLGRTVLLLYCCVLVSLGLIQLRIPVGPLELGLTEVLFLILLPVWSIRSRFRRPTLHQKWMWIAVTVYLLTGLLSAIMSTSPGTSSKHMLGEIYLALLFVVSATLISDFRGLKIVIGAWLVGAVIACFTALATIALYYINRQNPLLEFLTYHYGSVPIGNFPRVTATFASASLYFNYLSVSVVLLLCSWKAGWISKRLCQIALVTALISATFTFSIGLGSFFLIAAWWVYISNRNQSKIRGPVVLFLVLASLIWFVLAIVALQPFSEAPFAIGLPWTEFQIYPSARYLVWTDTVRTIRSHFIYGVGAGTPVCNVIFTNTDGTLSLLTDAHNTFLNVLAERGVIGALAITTAVALILKGSGFGEPDAESRTQRLVSNGLKFALLIGFVYQGLVGSFEDAKHLWVLMGITIAAGDIEAKEGAAKRSENKH